MPQSVGIKNRPSSADSYPMYFDWSAVDVFSASAVTSCTVSAAAVEGTAPTIGSVTVATNVATFNVSGGTAGTSVLTFTATNALSQVMRFEGTLITN